MDWGLVVTLALVAVGSREKCLAGDKGYWSSFFGGGVERRLNFAQHLFA